MDRKECILVVDDDEGVRKSLSLILKKKGYQVESAGTGAEALSIAEGIPISLALLDIKLPDIEGTELLATLLQVNPDMSIIMITGFASVESAVQALTAGASDFITKPLNMEELSLKIKYTLNHQRLVAEARQAAEEKDRASKEIHDLYNNAPCGYHSLDKDGVIVRINDTELSWLGYSREEITGRKKFPDLLTEKAREKFITQDFPRYNEQGWIHGLEVDLVRKDGTILPVLVSATAIKNPDGSILMSRSTLFDITERRRAEVALIQEKIFSDRLFDAPEDTVFLFEPATGKPVRWNKRFSEVSGYSDDEIAGMKAPDDFYSVEDQKKARDAIDRDVAGNIIVELSLVTKQGAHIPFEYSGTTIETTGGRTLLLSIGRNMTGRKRAEEALAASEARLRLSVQSANIGLWDWDLVTDTVYFSPEWKSQIGYRDDELPNIFDEWQRRLHPDDLGPTLQTLHAYLANPEGRYEDEFRLMHKDGSYRWINSHADVIRDADGKIVRMLGGHIDITERKRAEEVLRENEARHRIILETAMDGFWLVDTEGRLLEVNDAYCRMSGYSRQELLDMHVTALEASESADETADHIRKTMAKGEDRFEALHRRKDGSIFNVEISVQYRPVEGGRLIAFLRDITSRRQTEEELRESESFNRGLVENLPDYIIVYGADGKILYVNPATERTLGYRPEELIGTSLFSYIAPEHHENAISQMKSRNEGSEVPAYEIDIVSKDGHRRSVVVKGVPVRYHDKPAVLILLSDITDRKRADDLIRTTLQRLDTLISSLYAGVMTVSEDGRVEHVNSAFCDLFNLPDAPGSLIGLAAPEMIEKILDAYASPAEALTRIREITTRGEPVRGEEVTMRNGRVVLVDYIPVIDKAGQRRGHIWHHQDITRRKRADEALQLQGEILEKMAEGVALVRVSDGVIVYANPRFEFMFGYDKDELTGRQVSSINAPGERDPKVVANEIINSLTQSGIWSGEVHNSRKDGTTFWCYAIVSTYNHPQYGQVWVSVQMDISGRKKVEEELVENRALLNSIIQGTTDAIYVKDLQGRYLLFNPAAEHVTGKKSEDVLGNDDTFLFPQDEAAVVMNGDQRVMAEGKLATYEEKVTNSQGKITTFLSIKGPVFDKTGNPSGLFGIARDITGRKQAEDALRESLQEKEVLLKEVHHRVKNNLQIISSLIYLQSKLSADPGTKEMLAACRNRITSMALLHENLFQVSNLSSVSMGPYISNIISYLADSYDTAEYLTFEVGVPGDINLDIDTGVAIGIIVTELATNSIKYAFPPGQAGRVDIALNRSGDGMLLVVMDNGIGLPEGYDLASSPGLGMKLVTNLVRQVHGTMNVKGDKGTAISIAFTAGVVPGK